VRSEEAKILPGGDDVHVEEIAVFLIRRICFSGVLIALLVLTGCSVKPATEEAEACPEGQLTNALAASEWAKERADIVGYQYTADVAGGVADVDLLADGNEVVAQMRVRQLFGDDEEQDGVMEAVLDKDSDSPLRLVTWGEDVDEHGYTVRMRLERPEAPTLHLTARFATVRCWLEEDPVIAPPCASDLPLDTPAFTLPSCGLIVDERIRTRQPPELTRLTYAVDSEEAAGEPAVGGAQRDGVRALHRLDVFDAAEAADPAVVDQWLAETGVDALVGTQAERLLTTAFLDRSWWRVLDEHVAHCDVEQLPRPDQRREQQSTRTETMTLCPGDQSNDDWGSSNDGSGSSVWGDPHLVTVDDHAYDLQAAGEFTLLEAHAGDPLVVQGRFEPLGDIDIEGCGDLSWNTAAATEVDGKRLSVRLYPQWEVRIDGTLVEGQEDVPELAEGASISIDDKRIAVDWPGGEHVEFLRRGSARADRSSLTVEVSLPPERRGQVRGLLGQLDGDPKNDLVLPDGTTLEQPASFEDLYEVLAPAWRVRESNSLFDYADSEDANTFYDADHPSSPTNVEELPEQLVADAEQDCRDEGVSDAHLLAACVVDVVCLSDSDQAAASANAPVPSSSQPPGRHDLVVERAVRHTSAPEAVVAEAEPEPADCRPSSSPKIALFDEHAAVALSEDVDVDLSTDGVYTVDASMSSATISSGTEVASYTLARRTPSSPDQRYAGAVRFAEPIVGVIVDAAALAQTDDELGRPQTSYETDGFEGLRSDDDVITIDDDARTLDIVWTGGGAHRIRVLTQTPQ
jgi:hypothetical protein